MRKPSQRVLLMATLPLVLALLLALSACEIPDPFVATSSGSGSVVHGPTVVATVATVNNHPEWKTFTDPIYGFSLAYPPSWILLPGGNSSHITLANPDGTTMSPIVSVDQSSPAAALAKALPTSSDITVEHLTVSHLQVADNPAVDIFQPYIPSTFQAHNSGRAQAASEGIVMAVKNDAGTTNVYLFLSYYQVDKQGNMSSAALADVQTVKQILATFQLPATIDPADQ